METAGQEVLELCSVGAASKLDPALDVGPAPSTAGPKAPELQGLGTSGCAIR